MMDMDRIGKETVLPCFSAMLEPDVVPLQDQYRFLEDRAW
jgi:hypothetical protein